MQLQNKKIALLATNGFEDDELIQPLHAVEDAGANVTVISDIPDAIKGEHGTEIEVDALVDEVTSDEFDALLLPGGVKNPDTMRMNKSAIGFVKSFFVDDKPVAAICHAPWLLDEAGVIEGKTLTSWPSLRTDLENAGALWVDEEVVIDENLITSRKPDDLPVFCENVIEEFSSYVPEPV